MKFKAKTTVVLVIFAVVAAAAFLFYKEGQLPVNPDSPVQKRFIIQKGEPLNSIINNLEKEGLIRNRIVFYVIVKRLGIEKDIQAGEFALSTGLTARELALKLTQGTIESWITVIEGLRKEEIAEIMAEELDISESDFNQQAQEGYLFPDTYLIPKDATAETVISIMKNNFDTKYSPSLRAKAQQLGLTEREAVTLASLVEKEALKDDRVEIASIMLRRLKEGMPLQIDATVQYALGYQPQEKRWWKKSLTLADLKTNSAYNTYVNPGLPPGPIANPGLAALEAVVNADPDTPYLFYLHGKNGKTYYGRTGEEHERNIERYLR